MAATHHWFPLPSSPAHLTLSISLRPLPTDHSLKPKDRTIRPVPLPSPTTLLLFLLMNMHMGLPAHGRKGDGKKSASENLCSVGAHQWEHRKGRALGSLSAQAFSV